MEQLECDKGRCSATALVAVVNLKESTQLDFCGHHFNILRPDLELSGFQIYSDERLPGQKFEVIPEKEIKKVTSDPLPIYDSIRRPVPPDDDPDFFAGAGA